MARQLDGIDVRKLQVGNQQAVRQWFEQYADPLYTLVFYGVARDADMAADIVQETFLSALERIKDYEPARGNMFAWLSYLSKNCIKKAIREKRRTVSYKADDLSTGSKLSDAVKQLTTQPLPEDVLERAETAELVRLTLGSIPARYRDALRQYYYQQKSIQEISESCQMRVGAVRTLLHRARVSFKKAFLSLAKYGEATRSLKGRQDG
jgi:RNA polymerase sigma-70 factor (ECF subfamily)